MKKLVIALVAVAVGLAANAASFSWQCSSGRIFDGTGTTGEAGYASSANQTAYLMFASVISQSDLVRGFNAAGSASAYTATVASKAIDTGTVNANARIDKITGATANVTADDTAYFVVFANDKMYVSTTATASYLSVGESAITFDSQSTPSKLTLDASAGYSSAGWYTAVPEPTSGLLLLLGVAGLALKRKRA